MSGMSVPVPRARKTVGYTLEVTIGDEPGVMTLGHTLDGALSSVDLRAGVHGSWMAGTTDALATAITVGLRHGTPAAVFADALRRIDPDCAPDGGAQLMADALIGSDSADVTTGTVR